MKVELAERESYLKSTEEKVVAILKNVPNITFDDVPLGGEEDSVEVKVYGDAKVAGAKFYYLKGDLALLKNSES